MQATLPSTTKTSGPSVPSPARSTATRVAAAVAVVGVIALGALVVRELMPRHAAPHARTSDPADRSITSAPIVPAAPIVHPMRHAPREAPVTAAKADIATSAIAAPKAPLAATIIAGVASDPDAYGPSGVFSPPAGKDQLYNFEPLPPFNNTTLRRLRDDPKAWELDAMRGPKLDDLGPEGAVRQAALVRDSAGNETPWYSIDSGPLAPAFALKQANAVRVMSREYVAANRSSFPPEVTALLDDK